MAKYTITIQEYCQSVFFGKALATNPVADPVATVQSMTEQDYYEIVKENLFPSTWPFYTDEEGAQDIFIRDFTDYFFYMEVGFDSIGKFKQHLKSWLRLEMGYYEKLYGSDLEDLAAIFNTSDIVKTIKGTLNQKNGTVKREGSVTYGKKDSKDYWTDDNQDVTNGRTDTNSIVALGTTSTERELSKQAAGGIDNTHKLTHDAGSVESSGKDENEYTDTYNTVDAQDLTETRKGHDNVDVGAIVEKYRELILDMNSLILEAMRPALFMQLF